MTREETKEKIADEAYYLNLQNLSGREDFQEAFKLGIFAGIEEAFELIPSWVSVEDRLPEEGRYLVLVDRPSYMHPIEGIAERYTHPLAVSNVKVDVNFLTQGIVTHWQPLPPKPTK